MNMTNDQLYSYFENRYLSLLHKHGKTRISPEVEHFLSA